MSYKNVTIPNLYSTERRLRKELRLLELENKILVEQLSEFENILYNIPEAVKQYGYVDIKNETSFLMTLIKKDKE